MELSAIDRSKTSFFFSPVGCGDITLITQAFSSKLNFIINLALFYCIVIQETLLKSPVDAAAIGRYLLPAGHTAANLQQRVCCCGPVLGQTDWRTGRWTDPRTVLHTLLRILWAVPPWTVPKMNTSCQNGRLQETDVYKECWQTGLHTPWVKKNKTPNSWPQLH